MSISAEQVGHIAKLARLVLSPEDTQRYGHQLGDILHYVADLANVDTDNLEPSSHALQLKNQMRDDHVSHVLTETEVFQNSQQQENGYFRVPQILQEGN